MDVRGKILVTGATGFIGTRLVYALAERGHTVRALSRQSALHAPPGLGWPAGWPQGDPRVEQVQGDITDGESLRHALEGCSHVFHLAAYAKNWAKDPTRYERMNVEGMHAVFEAARRQGVARVVFTSTIVSLGPTPPGRVGDEAMPRHTDACFTAYEATKTRAEAEALQMARDGFPVVVVNPTRVYGPGHLTEGNSMTLLIDQYDRGRMPWLLNRGVNVGNYVLVDDVVAGHLLAMERGRPGERYILGGENASLAEVFALIDAVGGRRHLRIPVAPSAALAFAHLLQQRAAWFGVYPQITPGWVRTFLVDWAYRSDKAERELGYRPTPLAEGIEQTYAWLQRVRTQPS